MTEQVFRPPYDPTFIGREKELRLLSQHVFSREYSFNPIFISGVGGVGKTSLIKQFIASSRLSSAPLWLDLYSQQDAAQAVDSFIERLYAERQKERFLVVVDGAEVLNDEQLNSTIRRIYNFKAVRSLIVGTRRVPNVERARVINLEPLSESEARHLLETLAPIELPQETIIEAVNSVHRHPLAISLIAGLLQSGDPSSLALLLKGQLYEIGETTESTPDQIVEVVRPRIVSANEAIIMELKKQPETIYNLHPRKFEEVLADLLVDMGWEVELTNATRDGGKDMLAFLNTELGKMLCLVEAKRYRQDRKIGVGLVRTLYGTLCDHQANSAMMVTTSSFSSDAQAFQKRHEYQLNLKDYADIVNWISGYRQKAKHQ